MSSLLDRLEARLTKAETDLALASRAVRNSVDQGAPKEAQAELIDYRNQCKQNLVNARAVREATKKYPPINLWSN